MSAAKNALPIEFSDILRKLRRAHEHASAFNDAAQKFWRSKVYAGEAQRDRQGRGVYRVTRVDARPPELGIYIGDAAHQLRSSLDHLMWLLANPVTEKEERDVQFPLVGSLAAFRGRKQTKTQRGYSGTSHMMPGVPRGVRTLVERLQPYHRRKWPQAALLGQIHAISNWDKHRALTTTAGGLVATETVFRIQGRATLKSVEHFIPVLKPGAILARFEVGDFDVGTTVYMKPVTTLVPQFDEGMPKEIRRRPIFDTLNNCRPLH